MEMTRGRLPEEWEERWRGEKEQRRRAMKERGEMLAEDDPELRRIVAYNDTRMGLRRRDGEDGRKMKKKNSRASRREGKEEEEEERWNEKEEGSEEEENISTYSQDTHARELFQTLEEFRDSSLFTDLTLSTEDGLSFQVHSPVLAAVSSLVHHSLQDGDAEWEKRGGSVNMNRQRQVSMFLGPGVDRVGLAGVLEFAYTGVIAVLHTGNVVQIQTAAQVLGVPRVLDLCREEEEKMKIGGQKKTEERKISAAEQMEISLQSIRQLWTQRVGCDVVLDVDGTPFYAHRVVLAASSDYFRAMFTSGMKESQQYCVTLPFLVASELEILIGHSYSGSLPLSWGHVFEISCTALQLQFQAALSLCLNFLQQEMDARSCLDVASFAEAYGMMELLEVADDFVLRNFLDVASTAKFLDLPAEKLLDFLRRDGLCAPSELWVFRAVVSWVQADQEARLPQARELMTGVRFPLMTFREFREVRAVNLRMECSSGGGEGGGGEEEVELYGSALREFSISLPGSQNRYRVRKPRDVLVLVGGDQLDLDTGRRVPSKELWFANSLRSGTGLVKEVEWRILGEMPEKARLRHGVAVLGGQLYVVGGGEFYAKDDTLKSAYRYDPQQGSWQRLADMQNHRSNFSLVVRGERLYAIGGDRDINANMDTVEVYSPESDAWSFSRHLHQALSGCAASVLDGEIFISGGFDCRYQCLVSMFLYRPERGTTYLADMNLDRALHCMEVLGRHLYVVGGVCNSQKFYASQLSCEVYDPERDSWSSISPLTVPHVGPASAVLEGKLYVLGGYCQEDYRECKLVHRYDPSSQRWENMGSMPGPNTDIRACVLHLPQHLRL
ncbi:kelch-like protein 33 [Osmerus eperlanus]|uniref:kelch-like protein 33 n=1 Tax=Osmerus eperlanus TaxID=29151 RepID=UPI002E0DFD2B